MREREDSLNGKMARMKLKVRFHGMHGILWLIVLTTVAWPLAMLLFTGIKEFFAATVDSHHLFATGDGQAFWNSIWSSLLATVFAVVIGYATAWTLHGLPKRLFRVGHAMALLPLLIPPFIGAFSWLQAYARAGLTDITLHFAWAGIFGWLGVVVLLAIHSAPLAYFACSSALARVPQQLLNSSRVHGANRLAAFRFAAWPLLRPAFLSASALIFAFDIGDFGIPFELGIPGHFQTAATQVYSDLTSETPNGFPSAVALSMLLVLTVIIIMVLSRMLNKSRVRSEVVRGRPEGETTSPGKLSPVRKMAFVALFAYTFFTVFLPFIATILVALTKAYGLAPVPGNWDVAGMFRIYTGSTGQAALHSVLLAGYAAALVSVFGLVLAELSLSTRLARWLNLLASVPYALPGTVVGVAVILAFNRWLYGTSLIIVLAYVARFWGLSDTLVQVRPQVPVTPLRAARVFGAHKWSGYYFAVFPFLAPVVESAAVLVFISAVYELTMSTLLYTPSSQTLAVVVLNAEQAGDVRTMAVISVSMTILIFAAAMMLNHLQARRSVQKGEKAYAEI
jgi:iron(III) transport system permease protein